MDVAFQFSKRKFSVAEVNIGSVSACSNIFVDASSYYILRFALFIQDLLAPSFFGARILRLLFNMLI